MSDSDTSKNIEKIYGKNIDIGFLKFFWQINPFFKSAENLIPKFLRSLDVLKNFSEFELCQLTKMLHVRTYEKGELVFRENDPGVGLYFIMNGSIDIIIEKNHSTHSDEASDDIKSRVIVNLEKGEYFGELAMLQDKHNRNATARAKEQCRLLGIFKPDLELMISERPVIAAKLLQSVSLIVANRLSTVTQEIRKFKERVRVLEAEKKSENE